MRHIAVLLIALATGCYAGTDELASLQPRSLAGTDVDGALRVGPDGALVLDAGAQRAFDYFLTADAELAPAELDAWVYAELGRELPGHADEAFAAWRTYLEYRAEAAAALDDRAAELGALESRLNAAVDRLGDAPLAAEERAQLARAFALKRAHALAGEAREAALAELAAAPGEPEELVTGLRTISAARLAGAGAAEVQSLRAEHFGAAAADRLADLDARRAAWDARVAALRSARAALAAGFDGTPEELAAAQSALEQEHFTAAELRRVHALDRIAAQR